MSEIPAATTDWGRHLVEALVSNGALGPGDAKRALDTASMRKLPVSVVLADAGLVTSAACLQTMSALSGLPVASLAVQPPSAEALMLLPPGIARRYGTIGYQIDQNGSVIVATAAPLGADQIQKLTSLIERDISMCLLADPAEINSVISQVERDDPDAAPIPEADGDAPHAMAASIPWQPSAAPSNGHDAPIPSPIPAAVASASEPEAGAAYGEGTDPSNPAKKKQSFDIDELLIYAVDHGASDLHLADGLPPSIRINGSIRKIEGLPSLNNEALRDMIYSILPQATRERFEATKELDSSYALRDVGRFRISVMQQRGSVGAVMRMIPHEIPAFESLGLPEVVASFAELRRGLVLVTGPTGSGKSTSLASILDIINATRPLHIITVEDPIEFLHTSKEAIVNQREVGVDTMSFAECLRHALRQDPDVILVGEMRDLETISTALTAAETGHLVFATLHTQDAPQTIDRIIDVFPTSQQDQVRIQLAGTLEAIVTQQLLLNATGTARVPIAEVLVCNPGIRNLIRTAKTHQIYSLMQTGNSAGMQTMDQALARAVRDGRISEAGAYDRCHNPSELRDHLKG